MKTYYMVDGMKTVVYNTQKEKEDNLLDGADVDLKGDQGLVRSIHKFGQKELGQIYGSWKSAFETIRKLDGVQSSALDLYGGTGRCGLLGKKVLEYPYYMAFDAASDCVKTVQETVPDSHVFQVDTHLAIDKIGDNKFDLVMVDMYAYTYNRYCGQYKFRHMLDRAFGISKKWVILTDSAIFGNSRFNKNLLCYKKLLGVEMVDWRDYYRLTGDVYERDYGFRLVRAIQWRHEASIMLMVNKKSGIDTPRYVGVESADDQKQVLVTRIG
jgi:hypothetical protein